MAAFGCGQPQLKFRPGQGLAPADEADNGGSSVEHLERKKSPSTVDKAPSCKQQSGYQQQRKAKHLVAGVGGDK